MTHAASCCAAHHPHARILIQRAVTEISSRVTTEKVYSVRLLTRTSARSRAADVSPGGVHCKSEADEWPACQYKYSPPQLRIRRLFAQNHTRVTMTAIDIKFDLLHEIRTPNSALVRFVLPAVLALTTHALVQRREPWGHHVFATHLLAIGGIARLFQQFWAFTWGHALGTALQMVGVFWVVLSTSMFTYRLFFHQACKFPGPLWARFTMWSWVPLDLRGQRHEITQDLHRRYGDVVRIGPNQLSVNDAEALPLIYGANTVKGPWYWGQAVVPNVHSLQNEPTHASHAARRLLWQPAFTIKAVRGYEKLFLESRDDLFEHFEKAIRSPTDQGRVDMHEAMLLFGFDTMSKLGFARSFELLKKEDNRFLLHQVERLPLIVNTFGDVPYMTPLTRYLGDPLAEFRKWIFAALDWRLKHIGDSEYDHADVFAYLTGQEAAKKGVKAIADRETLFQDAQLLIVAGSDTTANTMTNMLYELTKRPDLYRRLQAEMDAIFPDETMPVDLDRIRDEAIFLRACIYESMRLWPVVPTGLQRTVTRPFTLPSGEYIHKGACISVNSWTLHRDPRNYYRPDEFLPERWLDKQGRLNNEALRGQQEKPAENTYSPHNPKAFVPFSTGPASCIGRDVAWAEMRAILSAFLLKYDIEMRDEDYRSYGESFTDHFVAGNGPCWITLKQRKR